jgi:hypothetical protein
MKIEPSDEDPKAALAGFTSLFDGAKIVVAETPKAVTQFGGLGSFIVNGRSGARGFPSSTHFAFNCMSPAKSAAHTSVAC